MLSIVLATTLGLVATLKIGPVISRKIKAMIRDPNSSVHQEITKVQPEFKDDQKLGTKLIEEIITAKAQVS